MTRLAKHVAYFRASEAGHSLMAPLCIAYYVTGHGLGHATRVIEVSNC